MCQYSNDDNQFGLTSCNINVELSKYYQNKSFIPHQFLRSFSHRTSYTHRRAFKVVLNCYVTAETFRLCESLTQFLTSFPPNICLFRYLIAYLYFIFSFFQFLIILYE